MAKALNGSMNKKNCKTLESVRFPVNIHSKVFWVIHLCKYYKYYKVKTKK